MPLREEGIGSDWEGARSEREGTCYSDAQMVSSRASTPPLWSEVEARLSDHFEKLQLPRLVRKEVFRMALPREQVYNDNDELIGVQYVSIWEEGRSDDGSSFCSPIGGRLLWRGHNDWETWFNSKGEPVSYDRSGGNDLGVDKVTGFVSEHRPTTGVAGNGQRVSVQGQKRKRRPHSNSRGCSKVARPCCRHGRGRYSTK